MPAPSVKALLDYETNFEDALAAYYATVFTGLQILTPRTPATVAQALVTPRVTIKMEITGTGSAEEKPDGDAEYYEAHKLGVITIEAIVRRNASGQSLGVARGQIRESMLPRTHALTTTNLPYYEVLDITEGSCVPEIEEDNDEIKTVLKFPVEFAIMPEQWPVSSSGEPIVDNLGFAMTDNSGTAITQN